VTACGYTGAAHENLAGVSATTTSMSRGQRERASAFASPNCSRTQSQVRRYIETLHQDDHHSSSNAARGHMRTLFVAGTCSMRNGRSSERPHSRSFALASAKDSATKYVGW
jgi:hypothetical protein